MMRILLLILISVSNLCADGFIPMDLRVVLQETEVILAVEITQNNVVITHNKPSGDGAVESVTYACAINCTVVNVHFGNYTEKNYNTKHTELLVAGVWLSVPSSGLERHMKPGEQYLFLISNEIKGPFLLRAEKIDHAEEILRLIKEVDAEDQLIAKAQNELPNGIYDLSDKDDAQKIRLVDGQRSHLGSKSNVTIVRKELLSYFDTTSQIELIFTLESEAKNRSILIMHGQAYLLFSHSSNEPFWGYAPNAKKPPTLCCTFYTIEAARAAAKFWDISIYQRQENK